MNLVIGSSSAFSDGMMMAAALLKARSDNSGAYGFFSVILTVLASTASTPLMTSAACLPRVAIFSQRFSEATTSVESMSEPSWNLMPVLSGIV